MCGGNGGVLQLGLMGGVGCFGPITCGTWNVSFTWKE